jgi:hypothetical protein
MPARKKTANTPSVVEFTGTLKKETTGTFQFAEDGERDEQVSGGIYIKKGALDERTPSRVEVAVTVYYED